MGEFEENLRINKKICCYFVVRKKRYCKMLVSQGARYCGQHLVNDETSTNIRGFRRIPCPLDNKHSCYEHKLDQHLKICNAKERSHLPYFLKGMNQGELDQNVEQFQLNDLSNSELLLFISKIEKIFDDYVDVNCQIRSHKTLEEYISKSDFGTSANRHLKQNSSILGHLDEKGLMNNDTQGSTTFIEFGSGKGQLTSWVIQGVENKENSTFLLIDKGAQRYKFDTKLRYNKELKIIRLRIDIKDLNLREIEGLKEDTTVVGYGKHLCGAATDFSLRCLTQPTAFKVGGIVIALCCHHRCTWQSYTGKEFLKSVGFASKDFSILIALSSWAVSSSRKLKTENEAVIDGEDFIEHSALSSEESLEPNLDVIKENRYQSLGLTAEAREVVGRKTKQILDMGRVEYLRQRGFQANLVEYVSKSETLENIALIAVPKSTTAASEDATL